jgi:hypothetical protein
MTLLAMEIGKQNQILQPRNVLLSRARSFVPKFLPVSSPNSNCALT